MKHEYEYNHMPERFKAEWDGQFQIFNWAEFLMGVPSPLYLLTTYKDNGLPNACLNAWSTFTGEGGGQFCVMTGIPRKQGHTIKNIEDEGEFCVNFPNKDIWNKCYKTIENNGYDIDEITSNGLNVEKAKTVNAPRIKECFMSLECKVEWIKPLFDGSDSCIVCGRIMNVVMDEEYFNESKKGRYGESGYLFNIHSPMNPLSGENYGDMVGVINPIKIK